MKTIYRILLWLFIIVVVATAFAMTFSDIRKNLEPKKKETFEEKKQLKICLFYATWCGHCEKYISSKVFDTTFDELKQTGKFDNVIFVQIDSDKNRPMLGKYGVQGFPTIMAITSDGNLVDEFTGDRYDKDALKEFVKSSLQKMN